jgi:hypothetical protein
VESGFPNSCLTILTPDVFGGSENNARRGFLDKFDVPIFLKEEEWSE